MRSARLRYKGVDKPRRLAPLLCILGACSTILQGWLTQSFHSGPGYETFRVATNLVNHHAFANPFPPLPTGPTAHVAPIYPAIMALSIALFRDANGWAMFLFTLVAHGLHAALLPAASRAMVGRSAPGVFGAILIIVFPVMLPNVPWEAALTAVLVLVLLINSKKVWSGVLSGIIMLLNPAALFINLPVGAIFKRKSRVLFFLVTGLVCVPWIVRNYAVFHQCVFIRDNLGLELYAANNDCASPTLHENFVNGCFDKVHPSANPSIAALVYQMGEVPFNQARMKLARAWISTHPARFLQLTLWRAVDFWWPPLDDQPVHAWTLRLLFVLALPGMWFIARGQTRIPLMMAAILIFYPLPYYVVQYSYRFEYPILWIALIGAGCTLARLLPKPAVAFETAFP
jgi:hypothetical protein